MDEALTVGAFNCLTANYDYEEKETTRLFFKLPDGNKVPVTEDNLIFEDSFKDDDDWDINWGFDDD